MESYKYTYQDWVEGKVEVPSSPHGVPFIPVVWPNLGLVSREDANRIIQQQREAYKYLIDKYTQEFIWLFLDCYESTFVPHYYLTVNIEELEHKIADFKNKYRPAWNMVMMFADGHQELTYEDIQLIYSENYDNSELSRSFVTDGHRFRLISYINQLQWLKWFKEQEEENLNNTQKQHYQTASGFSSKEELSESKVSSNYTWPNLFLDTKQANKILALLSEYISDTGQWLENGRTLVALYAELKQKGYLKQNLSGEKVANALNRQFGTNFNSRNFQPADLLKAESYRDRFTYIPPYVPEDALS